MSEEYVSHKAVRDVLTLLATQHFEFTNSYEFYIKALEDMHEEILKIPTVDVEPVRHGHWMPNRVTLETKVYAGGQFFTKGDILMYGYVCSECGRWEGNKEPFCNCGAKMDGGKNV